MTLRQDLLSGKKIDSNSVLHDHHVFPRNARRKYGLDKKMLDGICNRILLLEDSNLNLGEGYPDVYFKKLQDNARSEGTLGGLSRHLRDFLIPGDPCDSTWADSFSIKQFDVFCRKRAELIILRVREIIGDLLRDDPRGQNELLEDD